MDIFVALILICGLIFFTGGALGILRFPDFYSRLHPAGKLDTGGSLLMLGALAIFHLHEFTLQSVLVSLKIVLIVVFIFLSSPTAIHGIVDAGVRAGLSPWKKGEKRR
ncbi:MAG: monovalent cation/H(+) antiporter subunit G [Deltaproteobacteria bacterium]|nr:monovalent cation/H(+) antiporter subunit G [Deltaproteobacteria bacterium]